MLLCVFVVWLFFFFKQKTAYELRISDWSSDVCSSDLVAHDVGAELRRAVRVDGEELALLLEATLGAPHIGPVHEEPLVVGLGGLAVAGDGIGLLPDGEAAEVTDVFPDGQRSEERRVGKECVSTCRSRWSPYH